MDEYVKYNKYFKGKDLPLDEIYINGIEEIEKDSKKSEKYFEKIYSQYLNDIENLEQKQ